MIERLLAAERALEAGDLDHAGRLFQQVSDADPRNAMAVVGLAVVAQRRGDAGDASGLVARALAIDPEDDAAKRLQEALEDGREPVVAGRPAPSIEPATGSRAAGSRRSLLDRLRALLRRPA